MQINVSQLLQEPVGSTRDYRVNEEADIIGDGKPCPVRGEVRLLRTQRSILAKCNLSTEVEITCSRCLSVFRHPLAPRFDEEFLPTVDVQSGAPLPRPEDASAFTIDEHHTLDLTEAIRQYALLAMPMKPLCRIDCAGLCPRCGHNLNQGKCDCPSESIDPRWSELAKLRKK
jgi:uncharacterized protein